MIVLQLPMRFSFFLPPPCSFFFFPIPFSLLIARIVNELCVITPKLHAIPKTDPKLRENAIWYKVHEQKHKKDKENEGMKLLSEIAQLGQLIQQLLQIPIRDLMLETGDERFSFLGIITAQTSCCLLAS